MPVGRIWLILALGACTGCTAINSFEDPALVGEWELDVYPDTKMEILVNGDGDATLFDTNLAEYRYDLDWAHEDPDEFEIDFKCRQDPAGCDQRDFVMKCEASSSGNNLDCQAQSLWDPPDFEWGRDN
jgi:hypothetical protein